MFNAALRLQAHWLPKRLAVAWACVCLRDVLGDNATAHDRSVFEIVDRWLQQPDEADRRAAEAAAAANEYDGAASQIALAVFTSEGSLAPEGVDPVPPDDRLCGQSVTTALIMAAYLGDPTLANRRFRQFLDVARKVAAGEIALPAETPAT
jgi:hypothetical protein